MGVSYKKLFKLLIDRGMKKKDLCAHFGRTPGAIESRLQRLGKM